MVMIILTVEPRCMLSRPNQHPALVVQYLI